MTAAALMQEFKKRAWAGISAVVLLSLLTIGWVHWRENHLYNYAIPSGIFLYLVLIGLSSLNSRKKISMLPIGSASAWLQVHIYLGLFSMVLFLAHTGFHMPNGKMEVLLAMLFWAVALSGVLGLGLSRIMPKRLNQKGAPIIFESIPKIRLELYEKAKALALRAPEETKMSTLSDFFAYKLAPFFQKNRNFLPHVFGLSFHMNRIWSSVNGVKRYLEKDELNLLAQLEQLIREKDELDHQYAVQSILKLWLFIHIPLTVGLMVFGALHGVMARIFSGS